jgi:hypothetical protein
LLFQLFIGIFLAVLLLGRFELCFLPGVYFGVAAGGLVLLRCGFELLGLAVILIVFDEGFDIDLLF